MGTKKYDDRDLQRLGGIISENIIDRFQLGFEAIDEIKRQVAKIPGIEEDISVIKGDVRIIKRVLKATNIDVQDHDKRIGKLEQTVIHA